MHEMTIAVEILRQLEELADQKHLQRITAVTIRTGEFRQVVPEAMDIAFESLVEGTVAQGAQLTLEVEPAWARCRVCGHEYRPDIDDYRCSSCQAADVELLRGNDIILTSIEADTDTEGYQ